MYKSRQKGFLLKKEKKVDKIYTYNEKLKYARQLRGWSQEELARRVGSLAESMGHQGVVLDVSTISRWERGRNSPSHFYRQLLCSLFEMNAEELGLLSTDDQPQQVGGEHTLLRESSSPQTPFNADTVPLATTYDIDTQVAIRQDDTHQNFNVIETPSSGSAPHSPFIRRRNLLIALLASATLSGAATIVGLFQFHSKPTTSAMAMLSRHWPEVTPDIHKKLVRVRVIQWMLIAHGWHLGVDGIFWVQTENAVMFFQENEHIPVTATVSSATWERLILSSRMVNQQIMYQGSQVKALQEMLNIYGASPRLEVDGSFGPLTETATKHFQQTHRLPATGQADLNTWCLLVGGYLG